MQCTNLAWNCKKKIMRQLEKLKHYIFDNIKKLLLIFFGYVNYVVMFKRFSVTHIQIFMHEILGHKWVGI